MTVTMSHVRYLGDVTQRLRTYSTQKASWQPGQPLGTASRGSPSRVRSTAVTPVEREGLLHAEKAHLGRTQVEDDGSDGRCCIEEQSWRSGEI